MAARSSLPTIPNTPFSTRQSHHDIDIEGPKLPRGGCNYTHVGVPGAPRCGCRRYWDKELASVNGRGALSKSAVCMCEHHACFHDDEPEESRNGKIQAEIPSHPVRSTTPRQSHSHSFGIPGGPSIRPEEPAPRAMRDTSLPETLQWSRFIHSGSPEALPAIPSQCLLPSDNGSWSSDSQSRYHLPFGGRGLNTLDHIPRRALGEIVEPKAVYPLAESTRVMENERPMQVYQDPNGIPALQSITEVATPSVSHHSQDLEDAEYGDNIAKVQETLEELSKGNVQAAIAVSSGIKDGSSPNTQVVIKEAGPSQEADLATAHRNEELISRLRSILVRMAKFPYAVENHEKRLDSLENASFTHSALEELHEENSNMDVRVTSIETRLLDMETAHGPLDVSSVAGSIDSKVSTSIEAAHKVDLARFEALEAQVAELISLAPPALARPWEVEVVFLPFGFELKGVWRSDLEMSQRSRGNSSVETQTQNGSLAAATALLAARDQSMAWERAAFDEDQDSPTLLSPKACGRGTLIDARLRSRGLVRTIQVYGPDAIDVQAALMTAFGDIPDLLVKDPYSQHEDTNKNTIPTSLSKYLGLQASWIPLRKLHKNSSLRFLSTPEMVTPALWTVQFLSSSVAMRTSGLRRLYVTHRDSYIQKRGDTADWNWHKLRQLPRVYPEQEQFEQDGSIHIPEADASESCWEWDERLDPPPPMDVNESFSSQVSSLSIRSLMYEDVGYEEMGFEEEPVSPSDHFSSAPLSPVDSTTPPRHVGVVGERLGGRGEKQRHPFRPVHIRTTSMPLKSPPQPSKRRLGSQHEVSSSPSRANSAEMGGGNAGVGMKRRRLSRERSPSWKGNTNTPRWSNGPPSPYAVMDEVGAGSKRATTPFAYATPHSNAPYVDTRPRDDGLGMGEIEIFEDRDSDGEEDFGGATNEQEEDFGSATNEFYDDDQESGGEGNALSDYDAASSDGQGWQRQRGDEEWQGVDEDDGIGESNPGSNPNRSFGHGLGLGLVERVQPLNDDEDEDAQSDASSTPSEYPSTQPKLFASQSQRARERAVAGFEIHVDDE